MTDKDIPEKTRDVEWVYFWPADGSPLLDRRGYIICILIAAIAVGAWILTQALNA